MEKTNHLSIRTDKALHDKIQYVAAYEGRSMSGQILYIDYGTASTWEMDELTKS